MSPRSRAALILDCDGVIFDSNELKLSAMASAMRASGVFSDLAVNSGVALFRKSFGIGRQQIVNKLMKLADCGLAGDSIRKELLQNYAEACRELYLKAEIVNGLEALIVEFPGETFVASGSDQEELRWVFRQRNLDGLFAGIFGSPTRKAEIVRNILAGSAADATLVGDAYSDWQAATENNIRFIYFSPHATDHTRMLELKKRERFDHCETMGAIGSLLSER